MMGYDGKYGKVTTEYGNIPDDEPVIVFRARDAMLPAVMAYYQTLCAGHGSPQRHLDIIAGTQQRIEQWQVSHPDQTRQPDSERSRAWMKE